MALEISTLIISLKEFYLVSKDERSMVMVRKAAYASFNGTIKLP